jgi:hypothetical protein
MLPDASVAGGFLVGDMLVDDDFPGHILYQRTDDCIPAHTYRAAGFGRNRYILVNITASFITSDPVSLFWTLLTRQYRSKKYLTQRRNENLAALASLREVILSIRVGGLVEDDEEDEGFI